MTSPVTISFPQFPHPTLTPIAERPTAYDIMVMRRELYANAQSIDSFRGGGELGHLGAIMPADDYLELAGVAFVPPAPPGPPPAVGVRAWELLAKEYTTYRAVVATLRAQLTAAVNTRYIVALQNAQGLFGTVSIAEFLAYLTTTYGHLTPYELEVNREKLAAQWDPANPIEGLWTHIATIRLIDPTLDTSVVMLKTQDALAKSGVFTHYLQTWRDKLEADQTWDNFQIHFSRADLDRKHSLTTQAAGYHSAHMARMATTPTAAAVGAAKSTPPVQHGNTPTTQPGTITADGVEIQYCWTHGVQVSHGSGVCAAPKPGHKTTATFMNRQGGNEALRVGKSGRPKVQTAHRAAAPTPLPAPINPE